MPRGALYLLGCEERMQSQGSAQGSGSLLSDSEGFQYFLGTEGAAVEVHSSPMLALSRVVHIQALLKVLVLSTRVLGLPQSIEID